MTGTLRAPGMEKRARAALLISSLRTAAEQIDDAVRKDIDILGVTTRKNMREAGRLMRRSADAIDIAMKIQVDAAHARQEKPDVGA